tara:strand:- start:299 stop:541 length:243 start_codon:yes stop_codon:yes gene_type:complete
VTEQEIESLIQRAAEEGAKQALREVGLNDENAFSDVRELRGLLDSWRDTKRTVGQTVTRVLTTVVLSLIAAGIWFNYGDK